MRMRILIVAALILSAFTMTPAVARDVRFPQTGNPAFTFQVPDDWTTNLADGNMIVGAADHVSAFSLSLIEYRGSLDQVASEAMVVAKAEPPRRDAAVTISGYSGYTYTTTMTNANGVHLRVKIIAVKLDDAHVATCTMITSEAITPDSLALAQSVLNSMALTHP